MCVPGPGVNLQINSPLYESCTCICECSIDSSGSICSCSERGFAYESETGLLKDEYLSDCSKPVYECNSACACSKKCLNRCTQSSHISSLIVQPTDSKGLGVFAGEELPRGQYIAEYTGEVLSLPTTQYRLNQLSRSESCFIVVYREHVANEKVLTTCVDASFYGNLTRFINHSCAPNVIMVPIRTDSVVPRLCLFTSRRIKKGEELCYSYYNRKEQSVVTLGTTRCLCGHQDCIGFLPLEKIM